MATPWRIQAIMNQLGCGLSGALAYVGASQLTYNERKDECTPDASHVLESGCVKVDTGLTFKVNGKRGQTWNVIVSLEPSDTYTVRLVRLFSIAKISKTGKVGEVLDEATDVYCDQLQDVVEGIYDRAIEKYNGGFINI